MIPKAVATPWRGCHRLHRGRSLGNLRPRGVALLILPLYFDASMWSRSRIACLEERDKRDMIKIITRYVCCHGTGESTLQIKRFNRIFLALQPQYPVLRKERASPGVYVAVLYEGSWKWRLGKERELVSFSGSNATLVPIP